MSETAHAVASSAAHAPGGDSHAHESHPDSYYIKIWGVLLALLVVSVIGPELGIRTVTLLTAFGIAFVKAFLVVKHFMHIGLERKFVSYLLVTMLVLMVLMVGGVGPDVLRHEGHRWSNDAAKRSVTEGEKLGEADKAAHGAEHAPAEHH